MKPAIGIVLTATVLNCVGASLASDTNEPVGDSMLTPGSKEPSWDSSCDASGSGSDYSCDQICPTDYQPVCASDGVTYANDCAFSIAQCKTTNLTLSAAGECAGGSSSRDETKPDNAAALCPGACLDVYDPVSDENGKVFPNKCYMQMAKCKGTKNNPVGMQRLYEQAFSPSGVDSTDDKSVSGVSGSPSTVTEPSTMGKMSMNATNSNKTMNTSSSSTGGTNSLNDGINDSSATKCAGTCLDIYSPVCGSNGVVYLNVCQLDHAACKNPNLNIIKVSEDLCADTAQQEILPQVKA